MKWRDAKQNSGCCYEKNMHFIMYIFAALALKYRISNIFQCIFSLSKPLSGYRKYQCRHFLRVVENTASEKKRNSFENFVKWNFHPRSSRNDILRDHRNYGSNTKELKNQKENFRPAYAQESKPEFLKRNLENPISVSVWLLRQLFVYNVQPSFEMPDTLDMGFLNFLLRFGLPTMF